MTTQNRTAFFLLSLVGFFLSFLQVTAKSDQPSQVKTTQVSSSESIQSSPADISETPGLDENWNPFQEIDRMQANMDRVYKETSRRMRNEMGTGLFFEPDTDLHEVEGVYKVDMDLPGMKKEEIKIQAKGGALEIYGKRNLERRKASKAGDFYQFERVSGEFKRVFTLPEDADSAAMQAKYENGVLELIIPKKKVEDKPLSVSVQ